MISEAGSKVLDAPPPKLNNKFLFTLPAFREFKCGADNGETAEAKADVAPSTATPEEVIDAVYIAVQQALQAELLERIRQNSARFFERVIVELLVGMGYGGSHRNASQQLGRSGDGGVDGVINEDVLGLDQVYVQAKRYAPGISVGRPEIQAFTGSLVGLGASKGVFVTTSSFSSQAIEFVDRIPQRVILIDGKRLTQLMIEHTVGVRASRVIEFKRLDEDFFTEE